MIFPPDFLWGTATSSHQVEGDNRNNDWWVWEQQPGAVLHGERSGRASDWWENAERDIEAAAEMGTNAHRLSLEWSRIEPEPGKFDSAVLQRYRHILQTMHQYGIEPMVTLHHFSNPLWLVEKGDFNSQIVVEYFQRFTAMVVQELGGLVPKWITINEPMVYVFMRYLNGRFPPPQKTGLSAAMRAVRNLLRCHTAAYHTIKEHYPLAQVGVAKNMLILEARPGGSRLERWWARQVAWLFNEMWMESMVNGRFYWPVGRQSVKGLTNSFDFVGVNYYTRFYVKFPPGKEMVYVSQEPGVVISDGGYGEVYPTGMYQVIKESLRYKKPIFITENGVPDAADKIRPSFLLTHLREIWRAINFNYPVMGYYHWSLVDNFEWDRGWTQRFGLIEIDPETQERRWRESGRLYSEICHSQSLSSEMAERYAPELLKTIFRGEAPQ